MMGGGYSPPTLELGDVKHAGQVSIIFVYKQYSYSNSKQTVSAIVLG